MTSNKIVGHVYVLNNSVSTNSVSIFSRHTDGTLTPAGTSMIGGQGSGNFIDSQGSMILNSERNRLFAVDAGSNQISVVDIASDGTLMPRSVSNSGGILPISLTYNDGRLYVLNAGDTSNAANVSGFRVHSNGTLSSIAGSTQPLSTANPNPAQVQVSLDGDTLIVTERNTNMIASYSIQSDGSLSAPTFTPSTGNTPFGFAFSPEDPSLFIVSDAGSGAATSYALEKGQVVLEDGPVASNQSAPCWVVITKNGRYAYTGNAGTNNISIYSIGQNRKLTLLTSIDSNAASGFATEMVLTPNSGYLYILSASGASLGAFQVESDGSLFVVNGLATTGITLPPGSSGIAVI